jgi:hypothetical protein
MHEALGSIPRNRKRKHRNESSHILSVILNKISNLFNKWCWKMGYPHAKEVGPYFIYKT